MIHVIHVLHLINDLKVGGAEILLWETLRRIDRSRFDLKVASLLGPGRLGEKLTQAGIEVIDLSHGGHVTWRGMTRLRTLIKGWRPDIIHAHLAHATLYARWLRKRRSVKCLISTQHFPPLERKSLSRRFHRYSAGWDDRTIAVSPAVAEELIKGVGVDPAQVVVIENGIDLTRFHAGVDAMPRSTFGLDERHVVIGTTASLTPKKGIDLLVQAAALVIREGLTQARFVIAGCGPEQKPLEELIRANQIEKFITLAGVIDEVPAFLRMLDIFCLPSRREPFGLSAAEAMACGCAVVHTRVPGLSSLSEDGSTAIQVDPDDAHAIATALIRLIGDSSIRRSLGDKAAVAAASRFSIDQTVAKTRALWESLIDQG